MPQRRRGGCSSLKGTRNSAKPEEAKVFARLGGAWAMSRSLVGNIKSKLSKSSVSCRREIRTNPIQMCNKAKKEEREEKDCPVLSVCAVCPSVGGGGQSSVE